MRLQKSVGLKLFYKYHKITWQTHKYMLLLGKSKTKGGWKWVIEGYDNVGNTIIAIENKLAKKKKEQEWLQSCIKQKKEKEKEWEYQKSNYKILKAGLY